MEQNEARIFEFKIQVVNLVHTSKKTLIAVILEQTTAEERLNKLRTTLLESQLRDNIPVEDIRTISSNILMYSPNQLDSITESMKKIFEPFFEYKQIIDEIKIVLKSKTLTPEQKIADISDLLI